MQGLKNMNLVIRSTAKMEALDEVQKAANALNESFKALSVAVEEMKRASKNASDAFKALTDATDKFNETELLIELKEVEK